MEHTESIDCFTGITSGRVRRRRAGAACARHAVPPIRILPWKAVLAVLSTHLVCGWLAPVAFARQTLVTVNVRDTKPISPGIVGIFFEDISYAADGGLYGELVQNRSFDYEAAEQLSWNSITSWELTRRGGGRGGIAIDKALPIHPNNPRYVALEVQQPGAGVGLVNPGFDGIPIQAGAEYNFSVFARQLYIGNRWGGSGVLDRPSQLIIRLENQDQEVLGETSLEVSGRQWQHLTAPITAKQTDPSARLAVLSMTEGGVALDEISLFPKKTFRNRPNGLRADLAQVIADLKPKFMRFPGGCLVHGNGLGNMYRWKDTIGPVEQRRGQPNLWGYHQSVGLGYFEYFQFCEDIGAQPLPVVPAGVSCQNSDHTGGVGQQCLPMEDMPAYIQDVLDLIEWANGPATSRWGAKRAAAGHPEPFHLKYLGVGNEDHITPGFEERFQLIYDALKKKHPEIVVIGTVGPFPDDADYTNGWKFANELRLPMVDEHCYRPPQWYWDHLDRWDGYDRNHSKVYLGEWAAHDAGRRTTLRSALAEAAYLTSLERNGDIVPMASYAPLLAKRGHTDWNPNLIYFSNTEVVPTINYYVQQLFSLNAGDVYLSSSVEEPAAVSRARDAGGNSVFLGTWNTQAEFDDVRVDAGSGTVIEEKFETPAQNWQADAGTWTVSGGTYHQSGDDEPAIGRLSATTSQTNYSLTLRARKIGGTEGFLIGFKSEDADNYYWWNLGGWGNTRDAVEKTVNGVKEIVGQSKPGQVELNRWYDIRVEVIGARIKCYLDGTLVHDLSDDGFAKPADFAVSSVRDNRTGDVILKIVNAAPAAKPLRIELRGAKGLASSGRKTVLAADDPAVVNDFANPRRVLPQTSTLAVGPDFDYEAPANSLTILRLPER